jgi:hypothetical protein
VSAPVPATVRDQAPDGSVDLLLDDGTPARASSDAVTAGGFRLLRSGQRVALHHDAAGVVVAVTLPGQTR